MTQDNQWWVEEFNEKFPRLWIFHDFGRNSNYTSCEKDVESFISQVAQKEREMARKEIMERIETQIKEIKATIETPNPTNVAIDRLTDDILSLLSDNK